MVRHVSRPERAGTVTSLISPEGRKSSPSGRNSHVQTDPMIILVTGAVGTLGGRLRISLYG
ncbi:hypothetical protein P3T21_007058 [Paraburkholderia sp. GAS334]